MTSFIELTGQDAARARRQAHADLLSRQWRAEKRPGAVGPPLDVPGRIWTWDEGASWMWILERPDQAVLAGLHCPADEVAIRWPEIRALAGAQGWDSLTFSVWADDPISAAVLEATGSIPVATKMQLAVAGVPLPVGVSLEPMSPQRFAAFRERSIEVYVDDLLASGPSTDRASARAEAVRITDGQLSDGVATAGHTLCQIRRDDQLVGDLWIADDRHRCFLYDIVVDQALRGQGIGTQALRAAAEHTRRNGAIWLGLNVFAANSRAHALYLREGFTVTEQIVTLELT